MFEIKLGDTIIAGHKGQNLRDLLLQQGLKPYNQSKYASCQGFGSCGTCAVEVITGDAGPITKMEKWRLRFPPHRNGPNPMRLACQITLQGDLVLKKWPGFWGSKRLQRAIK